jgi:hypothetical protein
MSRTLWFAAGAAAGVYAMTRARRAAEAFTYDGLHDRLSGLFVGVRLFTEEVKVGMAEKETELREHLALGPDGTNGPALTPGRHVPLQRASDD